MTWGKPAALLAGLAWAAACIGGPADDGDARAGGDSDGAPGDAPCPPVAGCGTGAADAAAPADGHDGAPCAPAVPPEVDGRITINELMAANVLTITDDTGAAADWLELHNPTDRDLDLCGYHLTDDLALPRKTVLAAGLVLPAGGHLVVWLDATPSLGPTHAGIALARAGGEVGLARPDGTWIDRVAYGEQEVDFSAAREPDGSDRWRIEWLASPGAANPDAGGAAMGIEATAEPPETIPATGDLSEHILGYDVIPELGLIIAPADADALESAPRTYVPADLVHAGRVYGPVGVRLKGNNSFLPFSEKPSLRINVDEYVAGARFFGLKDLTLNNMSSDYSMMHERLAYLLAREAALPASRCNHTWLTVNGASYGLYAGVETVKKDLLRRWFAAAGGPLFEATDVDFVAADVGGFEHETGPDDRSLLAGLAAALALGTPDAAIAAAGAYVDLGQFQRFWALESVVGQFDAMPFSDPGDDYFVYADPTTGRLHFLPWGMDETFYSSHIDVTVVHSVLARTCRDSPACFQAYVDQVWELLALAEELDLEAERVRVAAQIAPLVALDLRKPYSSADVVEFQTQLHYFLRNRRLNLSEMLPPPSSGM